MLGRGRWAVRQVQAGGGAGLGMLGGDRHGPVSAQWQDNGRIGQDRGKQCSKASERRELSQAV